MTNKLDDLSQLTPIKLRGRVFSRIELNIIKRCVRDNYDKGRTQISRAVCEELNWRQPNGWLKDRACRDVLRKLDDLEVIKLPPSHIFKDKKKSLPSSKNNDYLSEFDLESLITEFPTQLSLIFAKGNRYERIWNTLVAKYHYLGHGVIVGRCIKYVIQSNDRLLGAIAFSSSTWHVSARDSILRSLGIAHIRDSVINNSRFLILPNVQIPNLASHLLATSTRQIVKDWASYYSITPLIAETFVQPSLYSGTCYKAANWIEVGETKGYAKRGASFRNSQEPKRIFLYGLNKQIRRELRRSAAGELNE